MIIQMTATALLCHSLNRTPGMSHTAQLIADQVVTSRRHLQNSFSFGIDKKVFKELYSVAEEYKNANWDGYGAAPITDETYRNAYRFLEAMPLGIRSPAVGAEVDGHLTLEWHQSARRTLSVSVSPEGDLHYAAILGTSKAYGTEPFFGQVPKCILELINRVG